MTKLAVTLLLAVWSMTSIGCASHRDVVIAPSARIPEILRAQADAWNRGDIDGFMSAYWRSSQLTFSSGGQTKRGWVATRDGYRRRYPTPERMGQLKFSEIEVTPLCDNAALALGRWHLTREVDSIGGNFSLVFRRIGDQWKIIHDHTSTDEPH